MEPYKVFVLTDERDRILDINSDAFLTDTAGWVQIDEGTGDRCHHAQNNYFPKPKYDERGIPRYAYVPDGDPKWRERTQEEMDADYVEPVVELTLNQRIADLEEALNTILSLEE